MIIVQDDPLHAGLYAYRFQSIRSSSRQNET